LSSALSFLFLTPKTAYRRKGDPASDNSFIFGKELLAGSCEEDGCQRIINYNTDRASKEKQDDAFWILCRGGILF
jgi:hypothetical protein